VQDDRVTKLGNFTVLVPVNNTPVVVLAGHAHAASSWPRDSLPVSLDIVEVVMQVSSKLKTKHASY